MVKKGCFGLLESTVLFCLLGGEINMLFNM